MKTKNLYPIKHVAAIALELYKEKFPHAQDASTLGHTNPNWYLGNRLDAAFLEGWDAAQAHFLHQVELKTLTKK